MYLCSYALYKSFLEKREDNSVSENFINPHAIYESSGNLFIEFDFRNHAPEPYEYTNIMGGQSINRRVYSVFDKLTGELTLMRQPVKGKSGFKNDIDNGPVIFRVDATPNKDVTSNKA